MEIKMKYASGMWEVSKDLTRRLVPEQDEKLAKLIEATVARYFKRIEEGNDADQPAKEPDQEPDPTANVEPKANQAEKAENAHEKTPEREKHSVPPDIMLPKARSGMFRMVCPACKETFYQFHREKVTSCVCNCGQTIYLDDVAEARFFCPNCQKNYKLWTNSVEPIITSLCGNCHCEMTSRWNAKKRIYQPEEQ